jgi:hypothetical protein
MLNVYDEQLRAVEKSDVSYSEFIAPKGLVAHHAGSLPTHSAGPVAAELLRAGKRITAESRSDDFR